MIYDYLFYKSYQVAKKSKNFEDMQVLGGIWFGIMPCIMFNAFTKMFLIDAFFKSELSESSSIVKNYKFIFPVLLILLVLFYYQHKGRWIKIIAKYEVMEKKKGKSIPASIVLIIAYVISFGLGMLSAMYKNGDGVFK